MDGLGEGFDAENTDLDEGVEDLEEAADFGVVTESFRISVFVKPLIPQDGFDADTIDLDEGVEGIEEAVDFGVVNEGFRFAVFLKPSFP